jgi:hypothetical protein
MAGDVDAQYRATSDLRRRLRLLSRLGRTLAAEHRSSRSLFALSKPWSPARLRHSQKIGRARGPAARARWTTIFGCGGRVSTLATRFVVSGSRPGSTGPPARNARARPDGVRVGCAPSQGRQSSHQTAALGDRVSENSRRSGRGPRFDLVAGHHLLAAAAITISFSATRSPTTKGADWCHRTCRRSCTSPTRPPPPPARCGPAMIFFEARSWGSTGRPRPAPA